MSTEITLDPQEQPEQPAKPRSLDAIFHDLSAATRAKGRALEIRDRAIEKARNEHAKRVAKSTEQYEAAKKVIDKRFLDASEGRIREIANEFANHPDRAAFVAMLPELNIGVPETKEVAEDKNFVVIDRKTKETITILGEPISFVRRQCSLGAGTVMVLEKQGINIADLCLKELKTDKIIEEVNFCTRKSGWRKAA